MRETIVSSAGGDGRNALNIIEAAAASPATARCRPTTWRMRRGSAPLLYDKGGDRHYDTISAFIKSMRGSDADASMYYLAVMIAGGEDPKFVARRMIVFASEDVGNADPRALEVAVATARAVEFVGLPECRINLSQAPRTWPGRRSRTTRTWRSLGQRDVRERGALRPPPHLRDGSYAGAKPLGHGVGYRYPHDRPAAAAPAVPARRAGRDALLPGGRARG